MKIYHSILVSFISEELLELKSLSFIQNKSKQIRYNNFGDSIENQVEKYLINKGFSVKGRTCINRGMFVILVQEFKSLT
ncbi:MAG: hypothetical protein PHG08_00955 [Bacilli bacterium]|nr:hypothetical protein [Bacilli bacterium]